MPDLGKYADIVLTTYAVSLLLLAGLVAVTIWRGRRVRAEMEAVEKKRDV